MMNIIFEILAFHSHEICITFNITTLLLFAYIDDYTIANESFLSKMLKNTYPWSACSDKNFYILVHFVTTAICCLFACWWRLFRSDSRHGAQIHVPKKIKKVNMIGILTLAFWWKRRSVLRGFVTRKIVFSEFIFRPLEIKDILSS